MLTPQDLALAYDRYAAALWRGDGGTRAFAAWLEATWEPGVPSEPLDPPAAVSMLAAAGGIRWYGRDNSILGYVGDGRRGCYWVSVVAVPPLVLPSRQPARVDSDAGAPTGLGAR